MRAVASRDTTLIGLASVFLTSGQYVLTSYLALYLLTTFDLPLSVGSLFLVAVLLVPRGIIPTGAEYLRRLTSRGRAATGVPASQRAAALPGLTSEGRARREGSA